MKDYLKPTLRLIVLAEAYLLNTSTGTTSNEDFTEDEDFNW